MDNQEDERDGKRKKKHAFYVQNYFILSNFPY